MKWFRNFMLGRYGVDLLSRFLAILALLVSIVNIFTRHTILSVISIGLLVFVTFRTFSKKIYKRAEENQKYLSLTQPIRTWWSRTKNRFKYRKEYKYFKCSECKQDLRVPRKKGRIKVTCPKCGYKMEIKS